MKTLLKQSCLHPSIRILLSENSVASPPIGRNSQDYTRQRVDVIKSYNYGTPRPARLFVNWSAFDATFHLTYRVLMSFLTAWTRQLGARTCVPSVREVPAVVLGRQDDPGMGARDRTMHQDRGGSRAFRAEHGVGASDDGRRETERCRSSRGRQGRGRKAGERSRDRERRSDYQSLDALVAAMSPGIVLPCFHALPLLCLHPARVYLIPDWAHTHTPLSRQEFEEASQTRLSRLGRCFVSGS